MAVEGKLREDIQKKRPQADTSYFFMEKGGGLNSNMF